MYSYHKFYPFHSIEVDDSITAWSKSWRSILAELLGTMLFTFISGAAVVASNTIPESPFAGVLMVSLASGLAYMVLIFNFWNLSGGHLSPAVTFGAMVGRRIGVMKGIAYIAAQCAGGILGALLVVAATPQADQGHIGMHIWSENLSNFNGFFARNFGHLPSRSHVFRHFVRLGRNGSPISYSYRLRFNPGLHLDLALYGPHNQSCAYTRNCYRHRSLSPSVGLLAGPTYRIHSRSFALRAYFYDEADSN